MGGIVRRTCRLRTARPTRLASSAPVDSGRRDLRSTGGISGATFQCLSDHLWRSTTGGVATTATSATTTATTATSAATAATSATSTTATATSATTASATSATATTTTTSATASATTSATTTTATAATATTATSATSASATSAPPVRCRVPRVIGLRLGRPRSADPQGALLGRRVAGASRRSLAAV